MFGAMSCGAFWCHPQECCGFEASRLKVPTSATNGPLTDADPHHQWDSGKTRKIPQFSLGPCSPQDAVDISLWRVRHRCIVREPKMQGASAFLAWFLSEPFSCKEILLEVGALRFIGCNKLL